MSEENVAVVRTLIEAFRRRDREVTAALMSSDVEWDATRLAEVVPDGAGVYRGEDGTRKFWGAWLSSWQNLVFEYELRDAGDDVIALIRDQRRWGRQSGVETEFTPYAWVYTILDGRVVRGCFYPDHGSALEAAGLSEQAMSQENVETVRRGLEHFNREGYLPEDAFDPGVELTNLRESPLPGPYRGYEGLRKWSDDLLEVLDGGRLEIQELIDANQASAVIARVRLRGRARHTGIAVDLPFTIVSWMRNGRTYRSEGFSDHDEALKAAGLSEQAMSEENVEVVRKAVEAYARGDLETALTHADPDIVWNPVEEAATPDALKAAGLSE